ncbi:MAG: hypothetical protein J6Q53_07875, partial [Oscillospiraceae bacterium]|nr:hypothetical protein [Oscillospiraceae bacterium]
LAAQGILTYCANGQTTVPMYADADRLLVFAPSLTSASLSKTGFLTDYAGACLCRLRLFFCFFLEQS